MLYVVWCVSCLVCRMSCMWYIYFLNYTYHIMYITLCHVLYTLYICTLYTVHLYTIHAILIHYTPYTYTLYTIHLYTIHCTLELISTWMMPYKLMLTYIMYILSCRLLHLQQLLVLPNISSWSSFCIGFSHCKSPILYTPHLPLSLSLPHYTLP